MLIRGFSLLEMLLALTITAMIMVSVVSFYPKLHHAIMRIYLTSLLENATEQVLAGLIKDLSRAGFIANSLSVVSQPAIEINSAGNCVILRYDLTGRGEWRNSPQNLQQSDVFTYRYRKNNLDYQSGVEHCNNTATRWEKLFDQNEIYVRHFQIKQYHHYTKIEIHVELKHYPLIQYQEIYYVKNYNQ